MEYRLTFGTTSVLSTPNSLILPTERYTKWLRSKLVIWSLINHFTMVVSGDFSTRSFRWGLSGELNVEQNKRLRAVINERVGPWFQVANMIIIIFFLATHNNNNNNKLKSEATIWSVVLCAFTFLCPLFSIQNPISV